MKKMFVVSLVLAAAFAVGCSKKQQQTTPTGTEMKQEGGATGGATYGGAANPAGGTMPEGTDDGGADPCKAPK